MKTPIVVVLLAALAGGAAAEARSAPIAATLLSFVAGPVNAEDLVQVLGTPWLIASGLAEGAGTQGHIYLVNAEDRSVQTLLPGHVSYRQDAATFGDCPGKPDEARFQANGLSLSGPPGRLQRLLVVHHGERESIEVFQVDSAAKSPTLTWIGCAVFPGGVSGNGVTALPGGGFAATNFMDTDDPDAMKKLLAGKPTGGVLVWRPGHGWERLAGGNGISAANGIEASADGRNLFVAGWGDETLVRLTLGAGAGRRDVIRTGFHTDNLRWGSDGFLYASGQRDTVPDLFACAPNTANRCAGPFSVLRIDPRTLNSTEVLRQPGTPQFGGASTALRIGRQFWFGTPHGDRIAIGRAPSEQTGQ
jgi:hypothetical protein